MGKDFTLAIEFHIDRQPEVVLELGEHRITCPLTRGEADPDQLEYQIAPAWAYGPEVWASDAELCEFYSRAEKAGIDPERLATALGF